MDFFFSQMAWLRFISLDFIKRVTFFPFYMSIKILLFVGNNWPVNWPGPSDRWTRWWVNEKHTSKKMITKNFLLKKAMIEKENSLGGHTRRFWLDSFTRRRTISIFRQKVQRRHFYLMKRFHILWWSCHFSSFTDKQIQFYSIEMHFTLILFGYCCQLITIRLLLHVWNITTWFFLLYSNLQL